ncbi:DUF2147 domain-containing protein [Flavobacterium sp. NRK F10]|nr:DUF2147 domain-containing protein [Flavobacterium sp. NRK F10]
MYKVILVLTVFAFSLVGKAQTADPLKGKWINEEKNRILEFVKTDSGYEAVIVKAEEQSLIGKKQITGLRLEETDSYKDGVLYIFQKNRTASCSVKILDSDAIELKATIGIFSRKQKWTRYNG